MSNARRTAMVEATGAWHNASPEVMARLDELAVAHALVDKQVKAEFPLQERVWVEDYHANRMITGPVLSYSESSSHRGAGLWVRNHTGKVRFVSIRSFIFKEAP